MVKRRRRKTNPAVGVHPDLLGGETDVHVPWENLTDEEFVRAVTVYGLESVPVDEWAARSEEVRDAARFDSDAEFIQMAVERGLDAIPESQWDLRSAKVQDAARDAREAAVDGLKEILSQELKNWSEWEEEYHRDGDGASHYFEMLQNDLGDAVEDAVKNWQPGRHNRSDIETALDNFELEDVRRSQDKIIEALSEEDLYSEVVGHRSGAVVSFGESDGESERDIDDEFMEKYQSLDLSEIEDAARRSNVDGANLAEVVGQIRGGKRKYGSVGYGYGVPAYALVLDEDAARDKVQEIVDGASDLVDDAVAVALGEVPVGPGPDTDDVFTQMSPERMGQLVERIRKERGDDNGVSNAGDFTGDQLAAGFLTALLEITPAGERYNALFALWEDVAPARVRKSEGTKWRDPETGETDHEHTSSRQQPAGRSLTVAPPLMGPQQPAETAPRRVTARKTKAQAAEAPAPVGRKIKYGKKGQPKGPLPSDKNIRDLGALEGMFGEGEDEVPEKRKVTVRKR